MRWNYGWKARTKAEVCRVSGEKCADGERRAEGRQNGLEQVGAAQSRPEQVRRLQMVLWVGLILAQMAVVNCMETQAASQQEFRERAVEKEIVYKNLEGTASIPETLDVEVTDADQTVTVQCARQECRILEERWKDDFEFPLTFHSYDADYYVCGERLIPHSDEQPNLAGCEADLLELIGVSQEEYRIDRVSWRGEAYEGEDGTLCRDAVARGSRLVRDYEARYAGVARFPVKEQPLIPEIVSEEETVEAETTEETETVRETMAETAASVIIEETSEAIEPEPLTLWQRITNTLLVIIGLGVVLFFGGLLLLLILRLVKQGRSWYTERKQRRES